MEANTLFIIFISIFSITAIITLLGITNIIKNIKEKYLNALFSALILEVIAAVILLFRTEYIAKEQIPEIFYEQGAIEKTESMERDKLKFIELILKGKSLDSILGKKDVKINDLESRIESMEIESKRQKDFYDYIGFLEDERIASNGNLNLRTSTDEVLESLAHILFVNSRISHLTTDRDEILSAIQVFKVENNRLIGNLKAYKIYAQDIPIFVKEYLEETYELDYYISNPNVITSSSPETLP